MNDPFVVDLLELQPSQLYISAEKLTRVLTILDLSRPESLTPLPVKRLSGRLVLTDGHTRAFAAYRAGLDRVRVCWDTDDLDWEAYEICVGWCVQEGIRTIADLEGRVVDATDYKRLWLERCAAMQRKLAETRGLSEREGD